MRRNPDTTQNRRSIRYYRNLRRLASTSCRLRSPLLALVNMTDLSEATLQAVLLAERDDEIHHCLVCYADLAFVTVTDCGHNEICGVCYLRLRMLHHDKKCPICKTEQGQVIVDQASTAKTQFRDYPVWGNDLGPDFVYEEDVAMFIRRAYYEIHIQPLFRYACQVARCSFDAATAATATNTVATTSGRRGPRRGARATRLLLLLPPPPHCEPYKIICVLFIGWPYASYVWTTLVTLWHDCRVLHPRPCNII